jgi:PhnB protein
MEDSGYRIFISHRGIPKKIYIQMSTSLQNEINKEPSMATSIAPWLTLRNCVSAVDFYKKAFDAIEVYRLETPDGGLVAKLSINGAEFWLSNGNNEKNNSNPESVGGETIRMILTVPDPYPIFEKAIQAGATEVFPIGEDYGWRLGRLVDPFGLHWEIGHPLPSR